MPFWLFKHVPDFFLGETIKKLMKFLDKIKDNALIVNCMIPIANKVIFASILIFVNRILLLSKVYIR